MGETKNKIRKKFFSIAAPTVNLRKKGEGVSSLKYTPYILGG